MTKIVFACKSNSCRSQMAEGWAKDWLRRQKEDLDRLERISNADDNTDCSSPQDTGGRSQASPLLQRLDSEEELQKRRSTLDKVLVTSVALDSSAVFKCESGTCCGDACETPAQRKAVKAKAVEAMKIDGIDISSFVPKTVKEVLPTLADPPKDDSSPTSSSSVDEMSATYSSTLFVSELKDEQAHAEKKVVDRLIVLCSCGDDVKRKLVRRSKSVEEWDIDAPTSASKGGEGDDAYRRVSLEIRNEVNILMDSLLGIEDASQSSS